MRIVGWMDDMVIDQMVLIVNGASLSINPSNNNSMNISALFMTTIDTKLKLWVPVFRIPRQHCFTNKCGAIYELEFLGTV
jgi:hypothetical protein